MRISFQLLLNNSSACRRRCSRFLTIIYSYNINCNKQKPAIKRFFAAIHLFVWSAKRFSKTPAYKQDKLLSRCKTAALSCAGPSEKIFLYFQSELRASLKALRFYDCRLRCKAWAPLSCMEQAFTLLKSIKMPYHQSNAPNAYYTLASCRRFVSAARSHTRSFACHTV